MRAPNRPAPTLLPHGPLLRFLPVVHDRVVYAQTLHAALCATDWRPDVVAIDLPPSFEDAVRAGLALGDGPAWAARGLVSVRDVLPLDRLTGYRNTPETVDAVRRAMLQARRLAVSDVWGESAPPHGWTSDPFVGFEPVVFLFRDMDELAATARTNVAGPDRRYLYSLGFYDEAIPEGPGRLRRPTVGRAWIAPPAVLSEEPARVRWYDEGMGERMPSAVDHEWRGSTDGWAATLVAFAASAADERVFVIADLEYVDRELLEAEALEYGKRLVFVDIDAIELDLLRTIEANRYETEDDRSAASDQQPLGEAIALDRGDASVEAIRWAIEHRTPLAFVDREIVDEGELRTLRARPIAPVQDDALLALRGTEGHYRALRPAFEATRLPGLDDAREAAMAAGLAELLAEGKRVLFVCGLAHWGGVARGLSAGTEVRTPAVAEGDATATPAVPVSAAELVLGDERGDPRRVVAEFHAARRLGRADRFSYVASVASLQEEIRRGCAEEGSSVGRVRRFERMVERITPRDGFVAPSLVQLSEIGRATLPRDAWRRVAREAEGAAVAPLPDIPTFADFGVDEENAERRLVSRWQGTGDLVRRRPKDEASSSVRRRRLTLGGGIHTQPEWDRFVGGLHARAVELSPIAARLGSEASHVLRGHLDVARSLRARARGDDRWYSRSVRELPDGSLDLFESFSPVLFDLGIRSGDRWECLRADHWPDGPVIGMAITRRRSKREWVLGGLAVFTPSLAATDEARVRRWVRWAQRREPLSMGEIHRHRSAMQDGRCSPRQALTNLMLAAGDGDAVVVSDAWSDPELLAFARQSGKRLHRVPLARFDRDELSTLRRVAFHSEATGA